LWWVFLQCACQRCASPLTLVPSVVSFSRKRGLIQVELFKLPISIG
jgi:hypothetical protein